MLLREVSIEVIAAVEVAAAVVVVVVGVQEAAEVEEGDGDPQAEEAGVAVGDPWVVAAAEEEEEAGGPLEMDGVDVDDEH